MTGVEVHEALASFAHRTGHALELFRRAYAGLVLVSRDWCWERWAGPVRDEMPELSEWARGVLLAAAADDDDTVPDVIRGGA